MKIFAIRDENNQKNKNLAYLLYYEKERKFYIELPEDADEWETPLVLSSFLKKGQKTLNSYWSSMWVRQRIVPSDRQNLGQVLKENGLEEYDEFSLLMLADGRCAQDDYYLVPLQKEDLPKEFYLRYQKRIEDVVPLKNHFLLVFFRNGEVKKVDVEKMVGNDRRFSVVLKKSQLFENVNIQIDGYGVCWGEHLEIADQKLYEEGIEIPLTLEDFRSFVSNRVINGAEAANLLECSRQNIKDLVHRGKLHPIKREQKSTLFLKSEVIQRKWK